MSTVQGPPASPAEPVGTADQPAAHRVVPASAEPSQVPPPRTAWSWSVAGPAALVGGSLGAVLAGGALLLLALVAGLGFSLGSGGGGGIGFGAAAGAGEQAYLGALELETYEWYTDPALLEMGWEVCDRLAAGDDPDEVRTDLLAHPAAAEDIAATAVTALCPGEGAAGAGGVV